MSLPLPKNNNFFKKATAKKATAKKATAKKATAKKATAKKATTKKNSIKLNATSITSSEDSAVSITSSENSAVPITSPEKSAVSITSSSIDNQDNTQNNTQTNLKYFFKELVKSVKKPHDLLTRLCPNISYCITFVTYNDLIKELFNNFTNFDYAINEIVRIGSISSNGEIYKITYTYDIITVFCVLKLQQISQISQMSQIPRYKTSDDSSEISHTYVSDNLYYEFLVGYYFINYFNLYFPCFVETYGLYYFPSFFNMEGNNLNYLKRFYHLLNDNQTIKYRKNIRDLCLDTSNKLGILIQHIEGETFKEYYMRNIFIKQKFNIKFFLYEIIQLLYQIYGPLSNMSKYFTHYDLHLNNVLLYDVGEKKYIEMKYIYRNGSEITTILFKTRKICKIIDYGRCYFDRSRIFSLKLGSKLKPNDREELLERQSLFDKKSVRSLSSKTVLQDSIDILNTAEIIKTLSYFKSECPNLGKTKGYAFLKKLPDDKFDLKFINLCITKIIKTLKEIKYGDYNTDVNIDNLLELVVSLNSDDKELLIKFFDEFYKFKNVVDVAYQLKIFLQNPIFSRENDKLYLGHTCIGTMTIEMNGSAPILFEAK